MATKQLYSFLHPQRRRVQTEITADSITQSEFARESDINYLVEKHVRAGIPFPTSGLDQFADVSDVVDFQAAHEVISKAREAWYSLDPKVRRFYGDKPENFLQALQDPSQHDDLINLKVIKRPEPAQNQPAAVPPQGSQGVPKPKAKGGAEPQAQDPT